MKNRRVICGLCFVCLVVVCSWADDWFSRSIAVRGSPCFFLLVLLVHSCFFL